MKCSRDIILGSGGTRDLRRHQETKLHKHSKKGGFGVLPLTVLLWANKRGVCNLKYSSHISLGEHHLAFQLGDHCTKLFRLMFPDSSIAKDFKRSRSKATVVLKVIAQDCWKTISVVVKRLNTSASKLMRQLILPLHNKLLLCFDSSTTPKDR